MQIIQMNTDVVLFTTKSANLQSANLWSANLWSANLQGY